MSKEMNIGKAIEVCKELIAENSNDLLNCWDSGEEAKQAIETVLADRERLQKENDRLKNINEIINKENLDDKYEEVLEKVMTKFLNNNIEKDYIPKQVIKDKIEEFNKKLNILGGRTNGKQYTLYGKTLLQELLEESEEK